MDATLNHVDPAQLQLVWPKVRPGLEKVAKRVKANWIPEDVYMAIRNGHSVLYGTCLDGVWAGFVVLTPVAACDGKVIHIWAAYGERPKMNLSAIFLPKIEELALDAGAKRVTFWSPRRWERHVKPQGYEATQVEFAKELG